MNIKQMIQRDYKNQTKEIINLANSFNSSITATAKNAIIQSVDWQLHDKNTTIKLKALKREILKICVSSKNNYSKYKCLIMTGYEYPQGIIIQCVINGKYQLIIQKNATISYPSNLLDVLSKGNNIKFTNMQCDKSRPTVLSFGDSVCENVIPKEIKTADVIHYNCHLSFGRYNLSMDDHNINILTGECATINAPRGIGFMIVDDVGQEFIHANYQQIANTKLGGSINIALAMGALDAVKASQINRDSKNQRIQSIRQYTITQITNIGCVEVVQMKNQLPLFLLLNIPKRVSQVVNQLKKHYIQVVEYAENTILISLSDSIMRYEIDIFIQELYKICG